MKLFHSTKTTKKDSKKDLRASFDILRELGHTPMTDWVALLLITIFGVIGIAFFTVLHYVNSSAFIRELPSQDSNMEAAQIKTKEERLQDVIEIYSKKQKAHFDLLGVTKSVVAKDIVSASTTKATSTSVSTGTITGSSTSTPDATSLATSTESASKN
jgi:predicted PurR-regulated permease PerM